MNDAAKKLVAALDAALAPPKPEPSALDRALAGPSVALNPATVAAILARSKKPLASKAELAALTETRKRWAHCREQVGVFTPQAARTAWLQNIKSGESKIASGQSLDDHDAWDRADWEAEYSSRMAAGKAAGNKLAVEAAELIKPVLLRFIEQAESVAAEIETSEREAFKEFGVSYAPSALVNSIRGHAAIAARATKEQPSWSRDPLHVLSNLNLN